MFRRLALALSIVLAALPVAAQTSTTLQGLNLTGSPPTGFVAQPLYFNCSSTPYCWPYMQPFDGTNRATVNADGGLSAHVTNFPATTALNATPSLANGNGVVPTAAGAALSATNGLYTNILQGNAVLSATNPLHFNAAEWGGAAITNVPTAVGAAGTGNTPTINAWIVGGAGGGTAAADNSSWTAGTTPMTISGCEFTTGGATAITTAHAGAVGCTNARAAFSDLESVAGTALSGAISPYGAAYGGSPTGQVLNINAFVSNALAALTPGDAIATATYGSASPMIGSTLLWNGTTYDRWKEGSATGVGLVSLTGSLPAFAATPTVALNATPSLANGNGVVPTQGGAVLSATNGAFSNLLQGNAVLSATNGLFVAPTTAATWTVTQTTAANLNMTCANCSGSGASGTDNSGFTAGSSVFAPSGGFYQTTATSNPLTAGNWGTVQLTHYRAFMTDWFNSSGAEMGTSGSPVQVSLANTAANGTAVLVGMATAPSLANGNGVVPTQGGAVLSATNGGFQNLLQGNAALSTTNPIFSEITDGTHSAAATKNASTSAVATDPALVVAVSPNNTVAVTQATASNLKATVDILGNAGGTLDTAAGTAASTFLGAQGAGAAGIPMAITPANLTAGNLVSGTTAAMTGTTSTQVIAAVASKRLYVTSIHCNNSSTSVNSLVAVQDGSGGTTLDTLAAADNFGGEDRDGVTPLFWTTAGNALFAADVTTGASVICTASGFSG